MGLDFLAFACRAWGFWMWACVLLLFFFLWVLGFFGSEASQGLGILLAAVQ